MSCGDAIPASAAGGLSATPGNGQVTLTWSAGEGATDDYEVSYSPDGVTWTVFPDGVTSVTGAVVTGLTNGTSYTFSVTPLNLVGRGVAATIAAIPYTFPDEPTAASAVAGFESALVSFTLPAFDGGNPVTSTTVTAAPGGASCVAPAPATSCTVTGLTPGDSYTFTASSTNDAGNSSASEPASFLPGEVPYTTTSVPIGLTATLGAVEGEVILDWTTPISDGFSDITDYEITYRVAGGVTWSGVAHAPSVATTVTATGLVLGEDYDFRVAAVTLVSSPHENPYAEVASFNTATEPAEVAGVEAVAGFESATISWEPGVAPLALPATVTTVTAFPGGATCTAADAATSCTITGLTAGVSYTFTVVAENSVGAGPASPAEGFPPGDTPFTTATEPLDLEASLGAGPGEVRLDWTVPVSDGFSDITDYTVEYRLSSGGAWTLVPHATSVAISRTVTGLTPTETYDFRVAAVTSVELPEANPYATVSAFDVPDVPSAPLALVATPGVGEVTLSWSAPASDGGAPVIDYTVTTSPGGGTCTVVAPGTSCTVTGLGSAPSYSFTVSARNVVGSSSSSISASAIPFNNATGGVITTVANYNGTGQTWRVHTFNGSGTLTVTSASAPFAVAAIGGGGGGGGSNNSHHGGAGSPGVIAQNSSVTLTTGAKPVTVGTGGAGSDYWGSSGGASSMGATSASGGGGGWNGHEGSSGNPFPSVGPSTNYGGAGSVEYGRPGAGGWAGTAPGGTGWNGVVIVAYRIA